MGVARRIVAASMEEKPLLKRVDMTEAEEVLEGAPGPVKGVASKCSGSISRNERYWDTHLREPTEELVPPLFSERWR